jgi:hypothetical protein
LETVAGRVLAMESVSDGGKSWVLKSLVGGVSSPTPDATHFLTFGDQISVVYHSISSLVWIVVSSGIFWSFQRHVVRL